MRGAHPPGRGSGSELGAPTRPEGAAEGSRGSRPPDSGGVPTPPRRGDGKTPGIYRTHRSGAGSEVRMHPKPEGLLIRPMSMADVADLQALSTRPAALWGTAQVASKTLEQR